MKEHVFLLTIGMPLATVLIVFAMRYASVVLKARAEGLNDASRRAIQNGISDIQARLLEIERILREVG